MANDPLRVLGLRPGASSADIKQAYRALAKANHPDSAGPGALVRFLAIQAAYEQLVPAKGGPTNRGRASARGAEPWRADPGRADPGRARESRAEPPDGTAGPTAGPNRTEGSTGRRRSTSSKSSGPAGSGEPRRRATRKATFGSTTYDEVVDSDDPTWQGASWYGPTSGEYWTVNPREYADPRKHGPDYQSRASERAARAETRRAERTAARGTAVDGDGASATNQTNDEANARAEAAARAWAAQAARARAADAEQRRARTAGEPGPHGHDPSPGVDPEAGSRSAPDRDSVDLGVRQAATALSGRVERSSYRRLILALLAWPPLGVAAASVISGVTGCAVFSASCTSMASAYPWFAQFAIIAALLLVPAVARLLVAGTIAVTLLAFPAAATLVAGGASYDPVYGPASLFSVLAVVWLAGVALTLARSLTMRRAG